MTIQSLAQCYGVEAKEVKKMVRKEGDYGDVAVILKQQKFNQSFATGLLTLDSIVEAAMTLNKMTGEESVQRKIDLMASLCHQCQSDDELRFLVRSFANTGLRIGLSTKSVEKCVIDYFTAQDSNKESAQQRLQEFERTIFGYRIQSLSMQAQDAIFDVPIKAMVGRAASSPANVLTELGKSIDRSRLVADYKYDGERT